MVGAVHGGSMHQPTSVQALRELMSHRQSIVVNYLDIINYL